MRYFHLDGEINDTLFNQFISFCNNNGDHPWTIVIDSIGGSGAISATIAQIINLHVEKFDVSIYVHKAYSGAFCILYDVKKAKRFLTQYTLGMIHQASSVLSMNVSNKPSYWEGDAMALQNKQTVKPRSIEWASNFLTKTELTNYKKDKDIYMTCKRLLEVFPDATLL
jgi:ATP-dependent protease ClpP protease subunit